MKNNIDKEQLVLDSLNAMIKSSEPLYYKDFNKFTTQIDNKLVIAEKYNDNIGIKNVDGKWGWTTLSMIATITDCLTDKRLSFCVETEGSKKGIITGVQWFNYEK
jgi:hypothetical protein